MSIKVNIYGRDYSPVDFSEYNEHKQPYTGVGFCGVNYREVVAQVITYKFLERYCMDVSKYIIGNDESKIKQKSFCYYTMFKDKLYYQNIVGVLRCKEITLSVDDFRRLREIEKEDRFKNVSNEQIEEEFAEYLSEVYEIKLQIQSRFDGKHTYFLPTMLLQGKIHLTNDVVPSNNDELFKFLLVYWYKEHLGKAYIQGPYRTYQRFERNDDRFRGSLDVGRHIRLNMGVNNGKIAYSYRENTTDNTINHLVLHTYQHIKKQFPNLAYQLFESEYDMRRIIDEIGDLAPSFKSSSIGQVVDKSQHIISHPFYIYYEKLRQTCMKILRHEGISIFDYTEDEEVTGILFYIPDLWELYLESEMKKDRRFKLESQKEIKIFTQENDDHGDTAKQNTYPDFIYYSKGNSPIMILDAKFKEKWGEYYSQEKVDLDDYTKCIRDMNSLGAHATGVIFPINRVIETEEQKIVHGISSYNQYDRFYSFPLVVPDTENIESYNLWREAFESKKNTLLNSIDEKLQEEEKRHNIVKEIFDKVEGIDQEEKKLLRTLL